VTTDLRTAPTAATTADLSTLWAQRIGCARGLLPGSALTEQVRVLADLGGEEYLLRLKPGQDTVLDVVSALPRVAAALERRGDQVAVEPHPSGVNCLARLIVVDDSPLRRTTAHPGVAAFNPATGSVAIGLHTDGALAQWALWNDRGAVSGAIIAAHGSGGTNLVRGLLSAVAGYDPIVPWVIDVHQGVNLGDTTHLATRVGLNPAEGGQMLLDAHEIGRSRVANLTGTMPVAYQPTREAPLNLLLVDELDPLMDQRGAYGEQAAALEWLLRYGGKVGISVVVRATTAASNAFNRVGSRTAAFAGNAVVLAEVGRFAHNVVPGLVGDPALLPRTWSDGTSAAGLGYSTRRYAPLRSFLAGQS